VNVSHQGLAFAIIGGTMMLLVWGRLRYDLVPLSSLLAALACGIVPVDHAFSGFSGDILVIVGSALVVSAAIRAMGLIALEVVPPW
jgi:di/tricarboxylate transporter